jgi:hypothetical protein
MKTDEKVLSKSNKPKSLFLLASSEPHTKKAGSGSVNQWYGSVDLDPYQKYHGYTALATTLGKGQIRPITGHLYISCYEKSSYRNSQF